MLHPDLIQDLGEIPVLMFIQKLTQMPLAYIGFFRNQSQRQLLIVMLLHISKGIFHNKASCAVLFLTLLMGSHALFLQVLCHHRKRILDFLQIGSLKQKYAQSNADDRNE